MKKVAMIMEEDDLIHSELEHMALAYLAVDADLGEPIASAQRLEELEMSPSAGLVFQSALRSTIPTSDENAAQQNATIRYTDFAYASGTGGAEIVTATQPRQQVAFASVPDSIKEDFLFRLEEPIETPVKLEAALGLGKGSLKSVVAERTGEEGEGVEVVRFVFVTEEVKRRILEWLGKEGLKGFVPLFVELRKTIRGIY
ncbi:hypothetical protein MMC25_000600 [Agyrium rufum]|nr:hypothetical protein [Agyrium rufum]